MERPLNHWLFASELVSRDCLSHHFLLLDICITLCSLQNTFTSIVIWVFQWPPEGSFIFLNSHFLKWLYWRSERCKLCVLSHFSRVWLLATLWTTVHQATLSMGFSRQEYWSGSPCPPPGDLPNQGIEPGSPELQADSLPLEPPRKPPEGSVPPLKSVLTRGRPGIGSYPALPNSSLLSC